MKSEAVLQENSYLSTRSVEFPFKESQATLQRKRSLPTGATEPSLRKDHAPPPPPLQGDRGQGGGGATTALRHGAR